MATDYGGDGICDDDLLMVAWRKFKETDDYQNSLNWATYFETEIKESSIQLNFPHAPGSLWRIFLAGWDAAKSELSTPLEDE